MRDVQASSVGGRRGWCARKKVLVHAVQHVSEGGSQQLTYLHVARECGLVLAVLVGKREEVVGWKTASDSHTHHQLAHILLVGLCN